MSNVNEINKNEKPESEMTFEERKQKLIKDFEKDDIGFQRYRRLSGEFKKIESFENFIDFAFEMIMKAGRATNENWRFEHNLKELNKKDNLLTQQEEQLIKVAKELIGKGSVEIKKEDSVIQFSLDREKMSINVKEMDLEKKMVIKENNYLFEEKWLKEPEKEKDTSKESETKESLDPWNKEVEVKDPWEKSSPAENDNPWEKPKDNSELER